MAEALFNRMARGVAEAISAGTEPQDRPHPEVMATLEEIGIDVSGHRGRQLTDELVRGAERVITMGCSVDAAACPAVRYRYLDDWGIPDPKGQPPETVRAIREEIRTRVASLLTSLDRDIDQGSPAGGSPDLRSR